MDIENPITIEKNKMEFRSINPHNGEQIGNYQSLTKEELEKKLNNSQKAYELWRNVSLSERCSLLKKAAHILRDNTEEYARMITLEMGKPISESRAEVLKCAWVCEY